MSSHAVSALRPLLIPARRERRHRMQRRRRGLASLVVLALVATLAVGAVWSPWASADEFTPTVTLTGENPVAGAEDEATRTSILAGQDAIYRLTVRNGSGDEKYNTSVTALVPDGVSFVEADSLLGQPTIYASGAVLPGQAPGADPVATVPVGHQLWVWENIADLPAGATVSPTFTVRPDAGIFPVGSELGIAATAYTSNDPNLLPSFPGSSSVVTSGDHTSQPGPASESTEIAALRILKSEPSPESELLRGVHDNSTTYTLRVQHTGQGTTDGVTVVDYLPAGLEYLGGGGIDHTGGAAQLYQADGAPGGTLEYPGAAPLTLTPAPEGGGYLAEDSVETVLLTDAEAAELGLGDEAGGVYTKVTWTLGALSGGVAQAWSSSPGAPGEFIIRYRAAVPLFENTLDFGTEGAPSAESRSQGANLDNNTGPSTRHGQNPDVHDDAISYVNAATVQGTYQGPVLSESDDREQFDSDTEVIDAVDLRILKSVAPDSFAAEELATYTLDLATSEYTSAEDIVITDRIENGICPALPGSAGAEIGFQIVPSGQTAPVDVDPVAWNEAVGASCAFPSQDGTSLTGATLTGLLFDANDGSFTLTLTAEPLDAGVPSYPIAYTARQNETYLDTSIRHGHTSSGDAVANYVQVEATTRAIEALEEVAGAGDTETVWDDSEAVVPSAFTTISKKVLERDAGDPLTALEGDWHDQAPAAFVLGDEVWYRLTVDFPETIDTRNPRVTDYLPQGVELGESSAIVYRLDGSEEGAADLAGSPSIGGNGNRLTWALGTADAAGDRIVPRGSVLEIFVPGVVTGLSASPETVDLPQNLMKYRQENSDGEVFFLRDDAEIALHYGATLVKGVESVNGAISRPADDATLDDGSAFGSDRDGIAVVQDETIRYRVDVTAPEFGTENLVVWDVLPVGITAADVADGSYTLRIDGVDHTAGGLSATAHDPGAPDRPTVGSPYADRTVIVFTVTGGIPADAELTLGYTVIVPLGERALVTQEFENVAGIASYDAVTNRSADGGDGFESVTYAPVNELDRPVGEGEHVVPGDGTSDDSRVYVPAPEIDKTLVSTEIEDDAANNVRGQLVQGEYATFSYSVTLPAHTTVQGGVLSDDGVFAYGTNGSVTYQFVSASVVYPAAGFDTTGFDFDAADGTLTFPDYHTTGNIDETFAVTVVVWVEDADASTPGHTPNLGHGTALTNTARFVHTPPEGGQGSFTDTASVTYIEPDPSITKGASPSQNVRVGTDHEVEYTLVVSNDAGRPTTYDAVVVDEVPPGLDIVADSISSGGSAAPNADTGGTTITWTIGELGSTAVTLTYRATIDPLTGGLQSYTNEVAVTGYTLPSTLGGDDTTARRGDRTDDDTETITAIGAAIDKGVRIAGSTADFAGTASVPVGEIVEYQVDVTLNENINYWDPVIVDTLPQGLALVAGSITGPAEATTSGTVDGPWSLGQDGQELTWTYSGDITRHEDVRILRLTYRALVTDADGIAANTLVNDAEFAWNRVNDDDDTREDVTDDATVTLLHPALAIAKTVNGQDSDTVDPGETFDYELVVTNTGDTPAYDLVITDTVPAGVVVIASTISHGGVLTGADADTGAGGTITWDHAAATTDVVLDGPLHQAGSEQTPLSITLSYQARLADSEHIADDDTFTNTAGVTEWESFPDGGRGYGPSTPDTAAVTPAFPLLTLTKEPTAGDIAYAGRPFGWTLTATNTGDGPANLVELTDTLPANWTLTEVTSVAVAGSPWAGATAPSETGTGIGDDRQVLTWTFEGTPVLAPDASVEIAFLATPSQAALTAAGVTTDEGTRVPHTNTLTALATDTSDAEENASGSYADEDDTADAFIHAADLEIEKTGWEIVAGTEVAGWGITVTNNGPDTAVGPFTVTDTTGPLPEGIVVPSLWAPGWTCTTPDRGADGVTAFECTRTDPAETLAPGESFSEIIVGVQVAADVDPSQVTPGQLANTAVVTSDGTHDPDPENNEDDDPITIVTRADLGITKTVNTESPQAGQAITWQLAPHNHGPSVSRSTAEQPIVITDVVPEGISGVTDPSGGNWTAAVTDGGFPADAGDEIVFTYTGDALPVGPAGTITLSGTISPSWAPGESLLNEATITPVITPEDQDGGQGENPNTDDVAVTPGTGTTLGVSKTRVVLDGDDWRPATEDDPAPVAGSQVSYLVTVSNNGTADARGVTAVDELPGYLTFVSHTSVQGTWSHAAGPVAGDQTFTLATPAVLAPTASASFVLTATLDPGHTGDVVNGVIAEAENAPPVPDEDDSSSTSSVNLSVEKTHTGNAVAGGELDYTITVTNEGPSTATGPIVITDELPTGFGYVSATVAVAGGVAQSAAPQIDGQELTWAVGDADLALAPNATIVVTLTTAIAADVAAQTGLLNVATVDGPGDTDPSDNTWPDSTDVLTEAAFTIVKDVQDGPWVAGEEITYTLTVTNHGPSVVAADLTDVVDPGLTLLSISGEGWTCDDESFACAHPAHPVGEDEATSLTVTARIGSNVEPDTELTNTAEVTWTDSDGTRSDDDTADVTVSTLADLGLVKTAVDADGEEIAEAIAGDTARFRIDVTNHGPSTAAAPITVTDTLPAGLSYVGLAGDDASLWTATPGEITPDGQEVAFVLGDGTIGLAAGADAPELIIIVQVDASLPATGEDVPALVNIADVRSETPEPEDDPHPNADEAPLDVVLSADLAVLKSHVPSPSGTEDIGSEVDFRIEVTNNGPSTASGVTVTETLPTGLEYVGFDGGGTGGGAAWTQIGEPVAGDQGATVVFALDGTLGVGQDAPTLVVTATVTAAAYAAEPQEWATNVVVVDADQPDPDEENDRSTDPVPVTPDADLTLAKETLTDSPHAGREIVWRIIPENLGPAVSVSTAGQPVTLTDTVPTGVRDVSVDAGEDWTAEATSGFPAQAGDVITLTYTGDAVPLGQTAPITLTGTIVSSFTGEITNLAEIHPGATPDRDPSNDDDSVTDPVDDATAIEVRKTTVDPATGEATGEPVEVVPGTELTYELAVTATGTADARGVTVLDELPEGMTFVSFAGVDPAQWTSTTALGATEVELALTGALVAGDTAAVRVTVAVADDLALDAEDVTNPVVASAENAPDDTDDVTDPLGPRADLGVVKSHAGAAVAGAELQYVLVVTNHGPSVTTGPVVVTDELPVGLSYVAGSARVTLPGSQATALEPVVVGRELTWTLDGTVLAVGEPIVVTLQTEIGPDVPATGAPQVPALVNIATVDGPLPDDEPENDRSEDPTTITELTEVSIVKTVIGTGPFTAGTEVGFDLTVTVAGPSVARQVVLSDVVPEGLSLVSIGEAGDGWTWDQTTGVGTRDLLGLGEHVIPVTAVIDQAVPAGSTLVNTGVVEWTDSDGPKRQDDPEEIGVITDADLGIVKTAVDADGQPVEAVVAGTELRYSFEVTNHGPSQAVALLEITDELPEGLTFIEVTGDAGGWAVAQDGQLLTFTHPLPLAAGQTAPPLAILTRVSPDVADGEELLNVAVVRSAGTDEVPGTPDGNPENDDDDAAVDVTREVDLAVVKSHQGEARIGEELTFDLQVGNAGPSQATEVVLIDTLPAGLVFVNAAGEGWQVVAGEPAADGTTAVTATLDGPLAAGADAPVLHLTVLVGPGAYPEVTNLVEVSSAEPEADPDDNTDTDTVTVPAQADLGIVKTAGAERLQVGDTARYTLTVTNHGPTEHVGAITVTDVLPAGLRATAAGGAECEILAEGTSVECVSTQRLAVGDELVVTVDVDVLAGAWSPELGEVSNTAVVTGATDDPDPENDADTVVTPVDPDVRFELEKTRASVDGDVVHWALTVSSIGLNDAVAGVVVVDRLPAELSYERVVSDAEVSCQAGTGGQVECLVTGPIPTGESIELTIVTTTSQAEGTTVTNVAWLADPVTGETIPDTEDSADHRTGTLPVSGVVAGSLAALALVLLLAGAAVRLRTRRSIRP